MKSSITKGFRKRLEVLPREVREQAERAYDVWRSEPNHPGLHFKRVSRREQIFSVRVGIGYRALGLFDDDRIFWFWIGSHAEYDELLKRL